jgi:hypothetical protein
MSSLTRKECLKKTVCPKCGREFLTNKVNESPNCFYCELKQYPHWEEPDYRDVAAARLSSGTYTEEQRRIYAKSLLSDDPMPQFPGFPEEFDILKREMEIEVVPLTGISVRKEWVEEIEKWWKPFISVLKLVYDEKREIMVVTTPDCFDNPCAGLNLKYIQRFFLSVATAFAKKLGEEVEFEIHFLKYPNFDFGVIGSP